VWFIDVIPEWFQRIASEEIMTLCDAALTNRGWFERHTLPMKLDNAALIVQRSHQIQTQG
jgi:hypothetical protein